MNGSRSWFINKMILKAAATVAVAVAVEVVVAAAAAALVVVVIMIIVKHGISKLKEKRWRSKQGR